MKSSRALCFLAAAVLIIAGCKAGAPLAPVAAPLASAPMAAPRANSEIQPVSYQESLPSPVAPGSLPHDQIEFPESELTRPWLQAEIEARNPSEIGRAHV